MASPLELLAGVPLFEELEPEDLAWIAKATRVRSFQAGESLFEAGEPGRSLYILTAGTVEVLNPGQTEGILLAHLGPGDFLGEMALLNDSRRSATARAVGGVEALVLDKSDFRALLLGRPDVSLRILETMSTRIRRADEQIHDLSGLALRDQLTGLPNRLAFNERLDEESARARRYGGSFSVILVDIPDFVTINERHGRPVGDRLLTWVGRLLDEHTRACDLPFRFDEDMFAILCPSTPVGAVGAVAARLAALVAEARPPVGEGIAISLDAGCATCPDHGQQRQALYHHAQQALLAARLKG